MPLYCDVRLFVQLKAVDENDRRSCDLEGVTGSLLVEAGSVV